MAWIRILAVALAAFWTSAIRAEEKKEKPETPRRYFKIEHAKKPVTSESYHVEYQATGIKKTLIGPDATETTYLQVTPGEPMLPYY